MVEISSAGGETSVAHFYLAKNFLKKESGFCVEFWGIPTRSESGVESPLTCKGKKVGVPTKSNGGGVKTLAPHSDLT